jgi:hypothetical protein
MILTSSPHDYPYINSVTGENLAFNTIFQPGKQHKNGGRAFFGRPTISRIKRRSLKANFAMDEKIFHATKIEFSRGSTLLP